MLKNNVKNIKVSSAVILGSTGSVGTQTVEVVDQLGLKVKMLTAGENILLLAEQIKMLHPQLAAVSNAAAAKGLKELIGGEQVEILASEDETNAAIRETDADIVFHSVAGLAGLSSAKAAAQSGKRVAMANKEAVIAAGDMLFELLDKSGGELIPVDSEHSALYRLLEGRDRRDIKKLILTASGGPFRGLNSEQLKNVTPEDALCHPTWKMGKKITVDSATLMNKGFEIIEAVRLFGMNEDRIEVIIHPQSIIHSLVEYTDNTMTAQLGNPDMRDCIRYAVTAPHTVKAGQNELSLADIASMTFSKPDTEAFPLLEAAREAVRIGGTAPASLIAADEEAVEAFLGGNIGFTDISLIVIETLSRIGVSYHVDETSLSSAVKEAREISKGILRKLPARKL